MLSTGQRLTGDALRYADFPLDSNRHLHRESGADEGVQHWAMADWGGLFGPVALLAAVGWPDLTLRRYIRLLAEQQDVARDAFIGRQAAPTNDTSDLYPRLGEDTNKPKGFLAKLDDLMDPDRNS